VPLFKLMDLHRARLLLDDDAPLPALPALPSAAQQNDEEEYVPLKRRRVQEAQERSQRGRGFSAAQAAPDAAAPAREAQVRAASSRPLPSHAHRRASSSARQS